MYTVRIKFEQKGLIPVVFENVEAGQTLLELALKNQALIVFEHDSKVSSGYLGVDERDNYVLRAQYNSDGIL